MRLILRGKSLGFSLREIKEFLDLYTVDPMHRVQTEALLAAVQDRIAKLNRMRTAIDHTLDELQTIERQTRSDLDRLEHPTI
jgi:DNA-binding transcriptional MerR regulator